MKITSYYIFKRILFSLIIILSLQSFTIADDIQDLEIEGMSVGDSLLDYFSEDEIKNNIYDAYPNKEDSTFTTVEISTLKSFKNYRILIRKKKKCEYSRLKK